jgi:hypothetical protein
LVGSELPSLPPLAEVLPPIRCGVFYGWTEARSLEDFQDAIDLCKIGTLQLSKYCNVADEEKAGICLKAPDGMDAFCAQSWTDREKACGDQNDFNSVCEKINSVKDIKTMKDMSFCK